MLPQEFYDLLFRFIREFREEAGHELRGKLEEYVAVHPDSVEGWIMLGDLHVFHFDDQADTRECYGRAYALDPTDPEVNVELAGYVTPGSERADERVRQHLGVFVANSEGHRDEFTRLAHAYSIAKEYGLED